MKPEPALHTIYTHNEMQDLDHRLTAEIKAGYLGRNPLLIGVLKGSFMFMTDMEAFLLHKQIRYNS